MSDSRRYTFRLDNEVGDFYDELARSYGMTTPKLFSQIITNYMHETSLKLHADRIENLVDSLELKMQEKIEALNDNSKFYEHFGTLYMLQMWLVKEGRISERDLKIALEKGRIFGKELAEVS